MKKVLALILSISLLIMCIPGIGAFAKEGTLEGNGKEGNPFLIEDAADFISVFSDGGANNEYIDGKVKHYFLQTGDIVITNYTPSQLPFYGTYDGGNFKIEILNFNCGSTKQGLFSTLSGTVKNLTVDADINNSEATYVGGIAGYTNSGDIINCTSLGDITGKTQVGGITGCLQGGGSIKNCVNKGTITGSTYVAGIAGDVSGSTTASMIYNCANYGDVYGVYASARYPIGGIAGRVQLKNVEISKCLNAGDITITRGSVGAIVGSDDGKAIDSLIISDCFNTGVLTTNNGTINGSAYGCYRSGAVGALQIANYYDIANPTVPAVHSTLTPTTSENVLVLGLNGVTAQDILTAYGSNEAYECEAEDGYDYPNFMVAGDVTVAYDSEIGGTVAINTTTEITIADSVLSFAGLYDPEFIPTNEKGEEITTAYSVVAARFALPSSVAEEDIEYGMLISKRVSGEDLTAETCTKEVKALRNFNGAYGILFYGNMVDGDTYYVRPYVKYDGEYTYGTPSSFVFDAE